MINLKNFNIVSLTNFLYCKSGYMNKIMKKISYCIVFMIAIHHVGLAQNNKQKVAIKDCEVIKLENQQLKEQIVFLQERLRVETIATDSVIKEHGSGLDWKFIECVGDRARQRVIISLLVHNDNLPNQRLTLWSDYWSNTRSDALAYDYFGNTYKYKIKQDNGQEDDSGSYQVVYGTSKVIEIIVPAIVPKIDAFKYLNIHLQNENIDGGSQSKSGKIELSNIKINWR